MKYRGMVKVDLKDVLDVFRNYVERLDTLRSPSDPCYYIVASEGDERITNIELYELPDLRRVAVMRENGFVAHNDTYRELESIYHLLEMAELDPCHPEYQEARR